MVVESYMFVCTVVGGRLYGECLWFMCLLLCLVVVDGVLIDGEEYKLFKLVGVM